MKTLLLASALLAGLFGSSAAAPFPGPVPGPYHAFCKTMWLIAAPCTEVSVNLVKQIQAFDPVMGCDQCQYKLVLATPSYIKANHTSMDGLQAESIRIILKPYMMNNGCSVSAQSTSLGFTSIIDNGLNYCNLRNLISASGLTSTPGFMEMTNEWACLGYGLATCKA